jgi:hypothetical protein
MSAATLILKSVQLRPPAAPPMGRKARGREVAGVVHHCVVCGWESEPCQTLAAAWSKPAHECPPLLAAAARAAAGSRAPRKAGSGGARSGPHTILVNACLSWLAANKIPAWKMNTGAFMGASGHMVRAAFPGCADILGILPGGDNGLFLAVECKTGRGELTDDQKEFKAVVLATGGVFVGARSVDDLEQLLVVQRARRAIAR